MPIGLTNVPATFMQTINGLFVEMLDKRVLVFVDNILIYSKMVEEHFKLLEKVFSRLCKYELYCKLKKCSFLQRTINFLGFDITPEGLQTSDAKV